MIPAEVLGVFILASVLLALSPGPDNIFVLTQSALSGPRAGLVVTLGLCSGLIVHTTAVAMGVAVIFQSSAIAFSALKIAGAGYLAYLAWQAFRAGASTLKPADSPAIPLRRLYLRGIVMNVTNPKVSIFFLAFLPQFADPQRGSLVLQILALGAAFAASTILIFGTLAVFAGSIGQWLMQSARSQRVMNRIAGTVFLLLAAKLLITERG
ncbi:MAG: LysE family translocator [Woeseia sp.]|nr:LysE family translocator [Woeseia sp.]MBT8098049.1 LysE family translocator [Woeseia sp.]NNE60078.1 LysE family translocator [Woeseia sp.]NNL54765.1 LysE family translocator [Woeseia sp.]